MTKVSGYIKRKSMLYVTRVEYGDYTMNHVLGCAHGCLYPCYAFMMKKRFKEVESYEQWLNPYLVENTLELLDREIPRLKNKIKSVQLSFMTDPFMYGFPEIEDLSLKAIKKLNDNKIKCVILTKGILPLSLSKFSKINEYGITLITIDEEYRKAIEPNAAPISKRLSALKRLHEKGCNTWVSIEPYPTPNLKQQDLNEILKKISFVDKIIFGRTNYNNRITKYKEYKTFYNNAAKLVIDFCTKHNIAYHIKDKTITQ